MIWFLTVVGRDLSVKTPRLPAALSLIQRPSDRLRHTGEDGLGAQTGQVLGDIACPAEAERVLPDFHYGTGASGDIRETAPRYTGRASDPPGQGPFWP